ncbi:gliding motility-associated C-terminal domain-containing protein [Neolewinella litorea]|uniref:Gliding motility-associated C-terminal domain-containing protein n=1 Tax=Neolewinella litorea TaxID=2562452 RepID=A0A4S4N795_9BACT|nr:gliding motility-associated C-terminal domain-containing protein [Neolewinella litorea]THH34949.1 gliding motility-associated C-terminal domain-containing protein [Neolewinella litorea]
MTTAQFVLLMRTGVLLLTFLLVGPSLSAQENCSNGIDDDGDGLVDLNDKENCSCALSSTLTSLLPNPSLEDFDPGQFGCTSRQPGGRPDAVNQANCLTGWRRASLGTTDSWNAFTFTNAGPYFPSTLPLPLPSGTGVAGFWVGVRDTPDASFVNGDGSITQRYREYLAACLVDGQVMETGRPYRLTFSLGFMEPQQAAEDGTVVDVRSPETVELSIYGVRDCEQLNFGTFYGCPEESGAEGYELIANVTVSGKAGSWTAEQVDFVAQGTYAGFAIGGSCAADNGRPDGGNYRNYYFIDDLILNEPAAFAEPVAGPVQVDGLTVCDETITLTGTASPAASYQWYRNGVALPGETSRVLQLSGGADVDGNYVLRVTTAAGCALTEPVVIQRPVASDLFADTIALCSNQDSIVLAPRRFTGATFRWADGSERPKRVVTEPGTYRVTVSEACVEHTETIVVKQDLPFDYTITQSPVEPCVGETVTITVTSNAYEPRYYFRNKETGEPLTARDGELQVVAGEVEEILAFLGNGCGMENHTITINAGEPFVEPTVEIEDITCRTGTGTIQLSLPDAESVEFDWRDADGQALGDGTATLTVSRPGAYSVTLLDGTHCPITRTYTVGESESFTAELTTQAATCQRGGDIAVNAVTGTGPFRYRWFYEGAPEPLNENLSSRTNLPAGRYTVEITDANGCTLRKEAVVAGAPPLEATFATSFADCTDPESGVIEVSVTGGQAPYRYKLVGFPEQDEPRFANLPGGTYRLLVRDAAGCTSTTSVVSLEAPPVIDLGADVMINLGDSVVLSIETEGTELKRENLSWNPAGNLDCRYCHEGFATLSVAPTVTTEYRVTYTTEQQCTVTDRVLVRVDQTPNVYAPTAFSPNNDNVNDEFRIHLGAGVGELTDLMIFDRWGELIYQSVDGSEAAWDGTYRGQLLSSGVFAYVGHVRLNNGMKVPVKGSVTLVD